MKGIPSLYDLVVAARPDLKLSPLGEAISESINEQMFPYFIEHHSLEGFRFAINYDTIAAVLVRQGLPAPSMEDLSEECSHVIEWYGDCGIFNLIPPKEPLQMRA